MAQNEGIQTWAEEMESEKSKRDGDLPKLILATANAKSGESTVWEPFKVRQLILIFWKKLDYFWLFFQANQLENIDAAAETSSICASTSGQLMTAGEDGICRFWNIEDSIKSQKCQEIIPTVTVMIADDSYIYSGNM